MEHVDTFKEKGKTNYDYASVSLINHSIVGTWAKILLSMAEKYRKNLLRKWSSCISWSHVVGAMYPPVPPLARGTFFPRFLDILALLGVPMLLNPLLFADGMLLIDVGTLLLGFSGVAFALFALCKFVYGTPPLPQNTCVTRSMTLAFPPPETFRPFILNVRFLHFSLPFYFIFLCKGMEPKWS